MSQICKKQAFSSHFGQKLSPHNEGYLIFRVKVAKEGVRARVGKTEFFSNKHVK